MLENIKGIGPSIAQKLNSLGIYNEKDLISLFPKRYLDLSLATPLEDYHDGAFCVTDIVFYDIKKPFKRGKLSILRASGKSGNIDISVVWYNSPFVSKIITAGEIFTIFGKIKTDGFNIEFNNPLYEKKTAEAKFAGILPIYPLKGLIPQKTYREIVKNTLETCIFSSIIDEERERKYNLPSLKDAYHSVHFPDSVNQKSSKERIFLDSIVLRMAALRLVTSAFNNNKKLRTFKNVDLTQFLNNIGFPLTESQNNALNKFIKTMQSDEKLNAILCGDVGSGKTVVAAALAYFAAKNGYQAAIIAPTTVLAAQHYNTFTKFFANTGIEVRVLTSVTPAADRKDILLNVENGKTGILIGTHSLLNDKIAFKNLALVIADEQHKFGVAQRTALIDKTSGAEILTLSATPIPRSMLLASYGESEFVTIKRRFEGNITTKIVPPAKRDSMWQYLAENDGQSYVIAPKITDDEGLEKDSVEKLYKELTKKLPATKIGLLHGKMSADKKQDALNSFARGKTKILVSTTVVEVGVDVPDANLIVITDAESFGLASLHQLRGRVGRNGSHGYCFLHTSRTDDEGLKILTQTNDGFKIAEADFEIRGAGDIFGHMQSGGAAIEGITLKNINLAREIVQEINIDAYRGILLKEAEKFFLSGVSLN